jgi:hypothetical protein
MALRMRYTVKGINDVRKLDVDSIKLRLKVTKMMTPMIVKTLFSHAPPEPERAE